MFTYSYLCAKCDSSPLVPALISIVIADYSQFKIIHLFNNLLPPRETSCELRGTRKGRSEKYTRDRKAVGGEVYIE